MKVLILGGYGVFGGRLAQLLIPAGHDTIIAGRTLSKAEAFCAEHGGTPLALERDDLEGLARALQVHEVELVVDAAGPFQAYGAEYSIVKTALANGCHYLDLSDDASFTTGIVGLNDLAMEAGKTALSGVSTVPALSSAIVSDLAGELEEITLIETTILPGNRAPRGRSVMQAILAQVGEPMRLWRGGAWREARGWLGQSRVKLKTGEVRSASFIGAPDLTLFPEAFNARSVLFRAGLEVGLMHRALRVFGRLRSLRLLPRLDRFAGFFLWIADRMKHQGSNTGGMVVKLAGRMADGQGVALFWRLFVKGGKGPFVPAIPGLICVELLSNNALPSGAGPAIACFTKAEAEETLSLLDAEIEMSQEDMRPLFQQALPDQWDEMAPEWRAAHDLWDHHVLKGRAEIYRSRSILSRLIGWAFRFPAGAEEEEVEVTMERHGDTEVWQRRFGSQVFRSTLSPAGPGRIREKFGPFQFEMSLPVRKSRMEMIVTKGWFLGLAMPKWLLPGSESVEFVQGDQFRFDVRLTAPFVGLIVHYRGWLEPA
jgi:hypothetical protein